MTSLQITVSEKLYCKKPDETPLGKRIVARSIELMHELGYEQFTFRKVGTSLESSEASVYRYFQNKHQLLVYLINWYWGWLEIKMAQEFMLLNTPEDKLRRAIELLVFPMEKDDRVPHIDEHLLQQIVIAEYPKIYLTKEVDQENQEGFFLGYKRICDTLGQIAHQINPDYPYPHSLFTTVIEAAQSQQFFALHLPRLTDAHQGCEAIVDFLNNLVFNALHK